MNKVFADDEEHGRLEECGETCEVCFPDQFKLRKGGAWKSKKDNKKHPHRQPKERCRSY